MRRTTMYSLLFIVLLTALAGWIAWPGSRSVFGRPVKVVEGLDLQGGLQVLLEAQPVGGKAPTEAEMEEVREVVEQRVNQLGVTEPVVQTQGGNRIVVELPGVDDPDQAIRTFQGTGLLEFVAGGDPSPTLFQPGTLVNTTLGPAIPESGNAQATPQPGATGTSTAAPATTPSPDAMGRQASAATGTPEAIVELEGTVLPFDGSPPPAATGATGPAGATTPEAVATPQATAQPEPEATAVDPDLQAALAITPPEQLAQTFETIITGDDIASAQPAFDPTTGEPVVSFKLKSEGAQKFGVFTTQNVNRVLAIVLDKKVISAPVINEPITRGEGQITGVTTSEARTLAIQIRSGSLSVPLEIQSSSTVGATLGQESVSRSITAGVIGVLAVALFMILYYRLPGLVSVVALAIYSTIVFALFKLIPVTLTLAGIAGFVLSIGMAVDANVLIFARMKEELRRGRGLLQAVEAGFTNAWPSIRDSNVSTLITCAILIWFGSRFGASVIRGFAITLAIGVLVSMFSAIFATRTLLRAVVTLPSVGNVWLWGIGRDEAVRPGGRPEGGPAPRGARPR